MECSNSSQSDFLIRFYVAMWWNWGILSNGRWRKHECKNSQPVQFVFFFVCFVYFVSWFDFCFVFRVFGLFLWVIVCSRSLLLHKVTLFSPNIGIVGIIKEVDYGTVPPFRRSPFTSVRESEKKKREKKKRLMFACQAELWERGTFLPELQAARWQRRRLFPLIIFWLARQTSLNRRDCWLSILNRGYYRIYYCKDNLLCGFCISLLSIVIMVALLHYWRFSYINKKLRPYH